jgi:hypothetical protein
VDAPLPVGMSTSRGFHIVTEISSREEPRRSRKRLKNVGERQIAALSATLMELVGLTEGVTLTTYEVSSSEADEDDDDHQGCMLHL